MKKFWLSLLLILISSTAFADTTSISADAVANHTDLSVAFLSQIFGTVGNVLQSTSGQMFGHLMYEFNLGILVIAGVWLIGTTLLVTLRSATEGSFMGQNNKVPLIILRVALGVIFLVPNAQTGYSLSQNLMMEIIVKGAELGDMVWNYGLTYLEDGGQLWVMPTGANNGTEDSSSSTAQMIDNNSLFGNGQGNGILGQNVPYIPPSNSLGLAQRIFASEVCMVSSSIARQQANDTQPEVLTPSGTVVPAGDTTTSYNWYENDLYNAVFFPGGKDDPNTHYSSDTNTGYSCGYVTWDSVKGTSNDFASSDPHACQARGGIVYATSGSSSTSSSSGSSCEFSRLAVTGMVNDLLTAAKQYACVNYAGGFGTTTAACSGTQGESTTEVNSHVINALYTATINYANAIGPLANYVNQQANTSTLSFIGTAKQEGWLSAGRFYWDLVHVESATQKTGDLYPFVPAGVNPLFSMNVSSGIMSPHESNYVSPAYGINSERPSNIGRTVDTFLNALYQQGYNQGVINLLNNESYANSQGDTTDGTYTAPTSTGFILLNMILPISNDFNYLISLFGDNQMSYDPILVLYNIGTACLNIAADIWLAPIGSVFGALMGLGICLGSFDGQDPLKEIIDWLKIPIMLIAVAFFVCGAILTIYIPLYPFIIWIFSITGGWFTPAIEIMVAMPIIALGMTNSSGHEIWGNAGPAINHALLIIVKPALFVIGLIASMILSFVALKMVIWGFSGVAYDLFSAGSNGHFGPQDVKQSAWHAAKQVLGQTATVSGPEFAQDTSVPHVTNGNTVQNDTIIATGNSIIQVNNMMHSINAYFLSLLIMPMFVGIFALVVYEIVTHSYKTIYLLANIISFLGGRAENHGIESMSGSISSGFSGGVNKIGSGLQSMPGLVKSQGGGGSGDGAKVGTGDAPPPAVPPV